MFIHFPTGHFFISFSIDGSYKPNCKNIPKFIFDFKKVDYEGLCEYRSEVDFHSCYTNSDVEKVRAFIKESILAAMPHMLYPKSNSIPSNNPPWWTSNIPSNSPPWWTSNISHKINCLRSIRKRCKHNLPLSQRVQELELSLQVEMKTVKND